MKQKSGEIVKKQTLIDKTRKTVLLWVMGASVLLGAAVVASFMLIQIVIYNQKVISEKSNTAKILKGNIDTVDDLKASVSQLGTDPKLALANVKTSSEAPVLQPILDALPADDNRLALGASLQQKMFGGISNLSIDTLSVAQVGATNAVAGDGELSFSVTLSGTPDSLQQALQRLEHSIRPITVKTIAATSSGNNVTLQIEGSAAYQKQANLELREEKVK